MGDILVAGTTKREYVNVVASTRLEVEEKEVKLLVDYTPEHSSVLEDMIDQDMAWKMVNIRCTDTYDVVDQLALRHPDLLMGYFVIDGEGLNGFEYVRQARAAGYEGPALVCIGPFENNLPWSYISQAAHIACAWRVMPERFLDTLAMWAGLEKKPAGEGATGEAKPWSLWPPEDSKEICLPYFAKEYYPEKVGSDKIGPEQMAEQTAKDAGHMWRVKEFNMPMMYAVLFPSPKEMIEFWQHL